MVVHYYPHYLPGRRGGWGINFFMEQATITCFMVSTLPDISKWNTSNVTNMSYMFNWCTSLSSLPDISKWNTSNVTNINGMFSGCKSSLNIPSKFKN